MILMMKKTYSCIVANIKIKTELTSCLYIPEISNWLPSSHRRSARPVRVARGHFSELFSDSQHGFRNKISCLSNLLTFYNDLFHAHDITKSLDIVYLDFQKAFDKVPHNK